MCHVVILEKRSPRQRDPCKDLEAEVRHVCSENKPHSKSGMSKGKNSGRSG